MLFISKTSFSATGNVSYINYSQICARVLRQCLKDTHKAATAGRDDCFIKTSKWEGGKVVKTVEAPNKLAS